MCCDGTWNFADQKSPTNVTKVALAIAATDRTDGREQRVFYHSGVGTKRWERLRGGAFGAGLSRNVIDTYRFIVQNYEPGDELFFFGFSRGAFTARSAVGLVRNAGVLRPDHADRIGEAYALYRSRTKQNNPRGREAVLFRRSYSYEPKIHFIGVWDTVGSLGIPVGNSLFVRWINKRWAFHDTDLSTTVNNAFQALAIDEQRRPFKPAVWNVQASAPATQRIEQVWFSGVHCNIGGGYDDHSLSDLPLLWMVSRAKECGLQFSPTAFERGKPADKCDDLLKVETWVDPQPLGKIEDSRTGFYKLQRPLHRQPLFADPAVTEAKRSNALEWTDLHDCEPPNQAFLDNGERIACSAVQRRVQEGARYAPPGFVQYLDDKYRERDDDYAAACRASVDS
jgi:hypothetical protein